jgi:glycerate 2-kinase
VKQHSTLSEAARSIFDEAMSACSVKAAMCAKVQAHAGGYTLRGAAEEEPVEIDLGGVRRVVVIAAGKAAAVMLESLLEIVQLPEGCELRGVLIASVCPENLHAGVEYFAGGHPLPSPASFEGARVALAMVRDAAAGAAAKPAMCFFLISGGASAMMELPLDPAITLEDAIAFHRALVLSGATIEETNCVRKHFSAVKGGRLGEAAAAMPCVTLGVSDVPAGRLDVLASGPTLPDPSTVAECREILERYGLMEQFPARVREFFSGEIAETPKPGDFVARAVTLLSDSDLAEAARQAAVRLGFFAVVEDGCDNWEYQRTAKYLLEKLDRLRAHHGRVCLIAAGEITVQVPADAEGVGGRNQHFALHAATLLKNERRATAVLSAGSDGIDGNSENAGAVVDENTLREAALFEAAQDALEKFDSATFLSAQGAAIVTGPTGNNLRDLRLLLAE